MFPAETSPNAAGLADAPPHASNAHAAAPIEHTWRNRRLVAGIPSPLSFLASPQSAASFNTFSFRSRLAATMRPASFRRLAGSLVGALALLVPLRARAVDPFEIQVYDGTSNAPGVPSLELHANTVPIGLTTAPPPMLPLDNQTHLTLEAALGITRFWEIGAYLQTAILGDGRFDYAGTKLRSKFVTDPRWDPHWRIGVNLEVSLIPEAYDPGRWGIEIRPIAAFEDQRWIFAVNPIIDIALAGPEWPAGPSFEPAMMAKIKIDKAVALGLEYYANIGAIAGPASWQEQEHYLFEAFDLLSVPRFELNAGIGEGLTSSSNVLVIKVILGYAWDPAPRCPDRP
jgi:hypothetical protein